MRVTVIDYGIGNLYSVGRALECCGAEVTVSADPAALAAAPRLVLPGVGAFADGMQGLRDRGLVEPLRAYAAAGRPLLGICLGMQMLASISEEFGEHGGLDLIPGRVTPVPAMTTDGRSMKIPHIGWSELRPPPAKDWSGSALDGTAPGTAFYLVHSFFVQPTDPGHVLATCRYGGHEIVTAVRAGQVYGFQFHPEKSGQAGLDILGRFLRL